MKQSSAILEAVSATPALIADLQLFSHLQAEKQSGQLHALDESLAMVTSNMEGLSLQATRASAVVRRCTASMGGAVRRLNKLVQNTKELLIM